jgi:hypothetical protein
LAGHVGETVVAELLADGLIELADRVERLAEHEALGDLDAVAKIGHDLVGMAGHLGLARLSAMAAEMNRVIRGDAEIASKDIAAISEVRLLCSASAEAVRRHLDSKSNG